MSATGLGPVRCAFVLLLALCSRVAQFSGVPRGSHNEKTPISLSSQNPNISAHGTFLLEALTLTRNGIQISFHLSVFELLMFEEPP
ncbi:hypothetical protein E5288_WYG003387 [Bos mutus]|uniref:Uncharacterized protein n=1 Tax=Bos mutus TaxID=72004 RepID=A0A6B0RFI9_9CETA|nr:hypothetical protein [Bos mutus]